MGRLLTLVGYFVDFLVRHILSLRIKVSQMSTGIWYSCFLGSHLPAPCLIVIHCSQQQYEPQNTSYDVPVCAGDLRIESPEHGTRGHTHTVHPPGKITHRGGVAFSHLEKIGKFESASNFHCAYSPETRLLGSMYELDLWRERKEQRHK